jgi:hypothetical protein
MTTTKPNSGMLDLDTQINAQTGTTYTLVVGDEFSYHWDEENLSWIGT